MLQNNAVECGFAGPFGSSGQAGAGNPSCCPDPALPRIFRCLLETYPQCHTCRSRNGRVQMDVLDPFGGLARES